MPFCVIRFIRGFNVKKLTIDTTLFTLMKHLLRRMGDELFPGSHECFELTESHVWFNKAVARWLDIALYKAMQRIIKAVDLDDLSPVDDLVQHSSSAVDIRTVLMQIKTFWAQLCWPDVESSYAYISKILDVSFVFCLNNLNIYLFSLLSQPFLKIIRL